jgi:hypothetical protein
MREVESKFVGKRVTCTKCLRSYVIEASDKIVPRKVEMVAPLFGIEQITHAHFVLPCGHSFAVPK